MKHCWMFPTIPPAYAIGGRNGDLIQLLPCWKAIHDRIRRKPVVICSQEYASVFDGVSYVEPHPINAHWWKGLPAMKALAEQLYGGGIVAQFWQEPPRSDDTIGAKGKTWTTLQSHGHEHGVDMSLDPDYGTSMARRCGFSRSEWLKLPLVFDRRNREREELLARQVFKADHRPVLLYNFAGVSSPFGYWPEVSNALMRTSNGHFNLVDLGKVRGHRIFDVLGLIDRAVGFITCDTYSLHLALGGKTPYVAFTVDGWTSSVPKGNCVLHVKYNSTKPRLHEVMAVVESWKAK